MNQRELAERLDVSPSTVSNIFAGRQKMSQRSLERLSALTATPIKELERLRHDELVALMRDTMDPAAVVRRLVIQLEAAKKGMHQELDAIRDTAAKVYRHIEGRS